MYDYEIIHIAGKKNGGPDATSRYPTKTTAVHNEDNETCEELTYCAVAFANAQSTSLPDSVTWREVNEAALIDETP